MSNIINISININEYPLLINFKDDLLLETINKLIKSGYDIHFPSQEKIKSNIEYSNLIDHLNNIKEDIKNSFINSYDNELYEKISSLEFSLNKLIGISSNSYKKGFIGENILEELFSNRYGDINFVRKSSIPHSGDAWLYLPDKNIIMLESKNYVTTVNKEEINKLQNDMITNNIKWGILISFNSSIQCMKELDYHTFNHNNSTYSIIMISNLSQDIHKLDLGLQIIRKIMLLFDDSKSFPWIINNINDNLLELNNIIHKNYLLRDNYYIMEREIQKSLSNYYNILRDYQYEIQNKINEIIKHIQSTIDSSLINLHLIDNFSIILEKYKDHKMITYIERLLDIFKSKKLIIENEIDVFFDKNIIIKIKILVKKVIINILNNEINITLNFNKNSENKSNLDIINKYIEIL
jgi:hypothetical protein